MSSLQVVLLGTGTPNAEPERAGACTAVIADGAAWLVDCGAGVVRRAAGAAERGVAALAPARLGRVLVTHLHSDHTVGLPDLLLTPWTLGRTEPLEVWGPAGTRALAEGVRAAFDGDVRIRCDGAEPCNDTGHRVIATEIAAGEEITAGDLRVRAIEVAHGSCAGALGYRFDLGDRSVVVTGDTRPCETLVEAARGCDVLVSEVYSAAALESRGSEWQRYHRAFHTSGLELGEMASRIGCRSVVLTHQLVWGASPASIVAEVAAGFDGRIVWGEDLLVVDAVTEERT
jgi:ribonuclease BN (tRNA processing enzyme)